MSRGKADWKVHLSVGWADPFYLQKTWHRVKSRSSKSFLVFRLHISNFNKIFHLTECDVCRLTPHWSSSRPALVTDNGDSGQQNIQTPPSIFRSCFSTQLCLPGQHPTVVLMLHTTTEFIWRLRCLYRAINMKMIATQEWNMEHKLAIMLIVASVSRLTSCCGGGRPLEYAPDASLLVQASYHVHRPWVLLGTPTRGLNLKNGTFKTWKYNWKVLWSTH